MFTLSQTFSLSQKRREGSCCWKFFQFLLMSFPWTRADNSCPFHCGICVWRSFMFAYCTVLPESNEQKQLSFYQQVNLYWYQNICEQIAGFVWMVEWTNSIHMSHNAFAKLLFSSVGHVRSIRVVACLFRFGGRGLFSSAEYSADFSNWLAFQHVCNHFASNIKQVAYVKVIGSRNQFI